MIRLKINLAEASTRRGLALFVAGGMALGHILTGDGLSWALLTQETFWLAIGTLISGMIGLCVPDQSDQKPPPP